MPASNTLLTPPHALQLPYGAQPADWQTATLPGTLAFTLPSSHTGHSYRILLGLPDGPASSTGYPVLWMLDGAVSFPLALAAKPRSGPIVPQASQQARSRSSAATGIIVAVAHASQASFDVDRRARDYTPVPDATTGDLVSREFGGAAEFRRFLIEELRPLIASHFPLAPDRHTLFGFSYGGLFTVDTLLTGQAHFQRYWAASPSLWFSDALLLKRLRARAAPRFGAETRIMLTVGRDEQFPDTPVPPERQAHLDRRAIVNCVEEAGQLLSANQTDLNIQTQVARDHDHFDMLMHGARRVQEFAFTS